LAAYEFGPMVRMWISFFPFFVIFDPEALQTILGSAKHTEKSIFYKLLHNFLGDGLITSSGDKWNSHRKYIQPIFHLSILEKFIETFIDSAQCLKEKFENAPEVLNLTQFINDCVLDILNGKIKV
jgi:cytochrome P450 family 4